MRELARSLAFWSALYTPLPGRPQLRGSLDLDQAIAALPRPKDQWAPLEAGTFSRIGELDGFPGAVEALGPPADPVSALSDLSAAVCVVLLSDSSLKPKPLDHTVTPIGAARILAPHLADVPGDELYRQLWQVNAAVLCGFAALPPADASGDADRKPPSRGELTSRAVDHKDPHVLKFTEVCVREHASSANPIYLLAAESVQKRTPPW